MLVEAAIEFDELCEIKDIFARVQIASEKFSKGEISTKTLRMLWNILDDSKKMLLLHRIYFIDDEEQMIENMRRCPPEVLMEQTKISRTLENELLFTGLYEARLLWEYANSKTENKVHKFKKLVENMKQWRYEDPHFYMGTQAEVLRRFIVRKCRVGSHETSRLGLPGNLTFGIELEFVGVRKLDFIGVQDFVGSMSNYLRGEEQMQLIPIKSWRGKTDGSVKRRKKEGIGKRRKESRTRVIHDGMECVSPILEDNEESWKSLEFMCQFIRFLGGRTSKYCGGHIHIGSNVLGVDSNAWKNFLSIWREVEPILYLIANRRGENARSGVAEYANTLEETLDQCDLKSIRIKSEKDLEEIGKTLGWDRYKGLNLNNLYEKKSLEKAPKNTIEFRIPNGSVDYDVIRENVLLFGKMVRIAKLRAVEPSIKKREFEALQAPGLDEKEKVDCLLNLLFEEEKEKEIYRKRWVYNAGAEENITVKRRKYAKQTFPLERPAKKRIKEIKKIADGVSLEGQTAAMEAMVADLKQREAITRTETEI